MMKALATEFFLMLVCQLRFTSRLSGSSLEITMAPLALLPALVHGQVDVRVAAPRVRELAVEAGVREVAARGDALRGQVDVRVAAPRVRELAVEAGVREVAARGDALRGQVVAHDGAAAAALVVQRAAVQRRTRALHRLRQQQHLETDARQLLQACPLHL
ncbi:hypothetical protein CRUP_008805 [Coryphaenoides rupestris]|nr:hypothetical protein CRUP_008805 [Coryphaenoides rupestris]